MPSVVKVQFNADAVFGVFSATAIMTVQCLGFSVFVCVRVCVHIPVSYSTHVEVRGQLVLFHRVSTRV